MLAQLHDARLLVVSIRSDASSKRSDVDEFDDFALSSDAIHNDDDDDIDDDLSSATWRMRRALRWLACAPSMASDALRLDEPIAASTLGGDERRFCQLRPTSLTAIALAQHTAAPLARIAAAYDESMTTTTTATMTTRTLAGGKRRRRQRVVRAPALAAFVALHNATVHSVCGELRSSYDINPCATYFLNKK